MPRYGRTPVQAIGVDVWLSSKTIKCPLSPSSDASPCVAAGSSGRCFQSFGKAMLPSELPKKAAMMVLWRDAHQGCSRIREPRTMMVENGTISWAMSVLSIRQNGCPVHHLRALQSGSEVYLYTSKLPAYGVSQDHSLIWIHMAACQPLHEQKVSITVACTCD